MNYEVTNNTSQPLVILYGQVAGSIYLVYGQKTYIKSINHLSVSDPLGFIIGSGSENSIFVRI